MKKQNKTVVKNLRNALVPQAKKDKPLAKVSNGKKEEKKEEKKEVAKVIPLADKKEKIDHLKAKDFREAQAKWKHDPDFDGITTGKDPDGYYGCIFTQEKTKGYFSFEEKADRDELVTAFKAVMVAEIDKAIKVATAPKKIKKAA